MSPIDVLRKILSVLPYGVCFDRRNPKYSKPGSVILSLPKEQREALKDLKSKDAAKERPDTIL